MSVGKFVSEFVSIRVFAFTLYVIVLSKNVEKKTGDIHFEQALTDLGRPAMGHGACRRFTACTQCTINCTEIYPGLKGRVDNFSKTARGGCI